MLTLSHCYAPERQYLPEGSVYTWQVPRYFSPPHKVTPLLVGSGGQGACHPGSKGTVAIGEAVFDRLPLPGHWRDSILKHTQILPVKEDHWLVLALCSEGPASGLAHTRSQRRYSWKTKANRHHLRVLPLTCSSLPYLAEGSFHFLLVLQFL